MRNRLVVLIAAAMSTAAGAIVGAVTSAMTPVAAATVVPNCATVSAAAVKAAHGGSPSALSATSGSTSSNSFYGYKATELTCAFSSSISISYSTPATLADFNLVLKTLKRATVTKTISKLGDGAFSGTGTNSISNCPAGGGKCTMTQVTIDNLWVLVTGKTVFEISEAASKSAPAAEQNLARKMVSIV